MSDEELMDQTVAISQDEACRLWQLSSRGRDLTDEESEFIRQMVRKTVGFRCWRARRSFR